MGVLSLPPGVSPVRLAGLCPGLCTAEETLATPRGLPSAQGPAHRTHGPTENAPWHTLSCRTKANFLGHLQSHLARFLLALQQCPRSSPSRPSPAHPTGRLAECLPHLTRSSKNAKSRCGSSFPLGFCSNKYRKDEVTAFMRWGSPSCMFHAFFMHDSRGHLSTCHTHPRATSHRCHRLQEA